MLTLKDQFVEYVAGLRFPWLLGMTLVIFLIDLVVIDFIPFADEIVLGLLAVILARLKKQRRSQVIESRVDAGERQRISPPE